jgi:hypothetical protein
LHHHLSRKLLLVRPVTEQFVDLITEALAKPVAPRMEVATVEFFGVRELADMAREIDRAYHAAG